MNINKAQLEAIFNEWARQVAADKDSFGAILDESGTPAPGYGESCARHFERIANDILAIPEPAHSVNFSEMVAGLAKPGDEILQSLSPADCHTLHMAVGISGEAGELLDAVKKAVIYRKPIDMANVVEELGDLEFYMEGIRQGLGITREQCIEANIYKLAIGPKARYKGGVYSDAAAQERSDKS